MPISITKQSYPHIRRLRGRAVKSASLPDRVEQCDHDCEAAFSEDPRGKECKKSFQLSQGLKYRGELISRPMVRSSAIFQILPLIRTWLLPYTAAWHWPAPLI